MKNELNQFYTKDEVALKLCEIIKAKISANAIVIAGTQTISFNVFFNARFYWSIIMNLLQKLEEYFRNTPKEQLDKDLEELEKYNEIGPDVDEYLKSVEESIKKYGCQIKKDK